MRVLITGAAGNIGSRVYRTFLNDGFHIRVLLHRHKMKNPDTNTEIVWGDITHPNTVKSAIQDVNAVVHLAGLLPPSTEEKPELAYKVNVGGTQTIVNLIKEKGNKIPFIYTSSVSVFGPCPGAKECLHPDRNPCNPTMVYARTKVQAEELVRGSGIDYLILRLTSIPYMKIKLSDMKNSMYTIPLENRLEFCHIDDVALAILNAVKHFDRVKGKTLVIGGGPSQQMRYGQMLRVIFSTFGLPLPPQKKFATEPFPLHWYDTSASQELLKFQRKTLDDYARDFAKQFPPPLISLMQHFIGPIFGKLIVRAI